VRRRRSPRWYSLLLVAGLALTAVRPLDAASFSLAPSERDEAIRVGRRSVASADFGAEWRVGGDGPGQRLTVVTPFHRLALAARNAAFKSEELAPRDVDSLVKGQEGQLVLWATLRGAKADFARLYSPALLRGQQQIRASYTQNERTALREEDGSYTARCMYIFPAEGLDPKGTVMLVVKDVEDKQVARFTVDLAAMR
jgi:hypothetical protein